MKYTFKIDINDGNGLVDISSFGNTTPPFVGFSDLANLNEELDSAYMEIVSDIQEIPTLSYIEFTCDNTKRSFYVGRDSVERLSQKYGRFVHKLELIETTKKLEKKVLETICFTQSQEKGNMNYSIWDCLQRLLRIYEIGADEEGIGESNDYESLPNPNANKILKGIDANLKEDFSKIEAPTLVLNNLTLREAFDEILRYVNAITRVEDRYTLSCEKYNDLKKLVDYTNKHEGFSTSENIEGYANELQSFVENQISENTNSIYSVIYPNAQSYDRLKTRENRYSINDTNCGILLNHPIYKLNDIVVKLSANFRFGNTLRPELAIKDDQLHLANVIVEQSIYDKLPTQDILNSFGVGFRCKNNTIVYRYKDNFIDLSKEYKGFLFNKSVFQNAIMTAFGEEIILNWKYYGASWSEDKGSYYVECRYNYDDTKADFILRIIPPTSASPTRPFVIEINNNDNFDFKKARIRTYYRTITNTRLTQSKNDVSDTKLEASSIINQGNRIISIENISNNVKSKIEKIGNYEYTITIRHNNISEIYNKGDFLKDGNDLYVCVIRECIYYNDYILCKYEFTKNYSRLSEFIGINSEIRQWQLPSGKETYERNARINSYCYISKDLVFNTGKGTKGYETPLFRDKLMNGFYSGINLSNINNAIYQAQDEASLDPTTDIQQYWNSLVSGSKSLLLECISQGTKDNLIFNFGFSDNINAGYYIEEQSGKQFMIKVPYCKESGDRLGFLRNCQFSLVDSETPISNYENLPLIKEDIENDTYSHSLFITPKMLILKDPSEIIKFTFQENFINKSLNDLIIGNAFNKYSNFVYSGNRKVSIYVSDQELTKNDIYQVKGTLLKGEITSNDCVVGGNDNINDIVYRYFSLSDALYSEIDKSKAKWVSLAVDGELMFAFKHKLNHKDKIFFTFAKRRVDLVEKY